jgi:hypothetical protein
MVLKFIPASALFTPDELAKYTYWLSSRRALPAHTTTTPLPTAAEFSDFQAWRHIRSSTTSPPNLPPPPTYPGFETAAQCKHPLHPGHIAALADQDDLATPVQYCSVCALQLHRIFVAAIWKRMQAVGGPWRELPADVSQETYSAVRAAFARARTALMNDVDVLDDTAVLEEAWEADNPGRDVSVTRDWSAARAMAKYRDNATSNVHEDVEAVRTVEKKRMMKRKVGFSDDTPRETRHRPVATWCRVTTEYTDDGPYACESDKGWCDTSFLRDWMYAIRQSQILFVYEDPAPSETRYVYRELNTGLERGENEHCQQLIYLVNRWLKMQDATLLAQWLEYLAKTAQIFLVYQTEDNPDSTGLFDTWERRDTLEGSAVEEYALEIGDLEVEAESELSETEEEEVMEAKKVMDEMDEGEDDTECDLMSL